MNTTTIIEETDIHGNRIYYKFPDGNEEWYNELGIIIHRKYSPSGREYWYNELGNLIRHKDEKGQEYLYDEYGQMMKPLSEEILIKDPSGNLLYRRYSNGDELWYDSRGNVTHRRYSDTGHEYWWAHDSIDSVVYYRDDVGNEYWFDESGNRIHDNNKC